MAFGSGLHGWGFNLGQFARMYAAKFKVKAEKLQRRLWGNHFYSPTEGKWRDTPAEGYERGFNKFVIEPLVKVLYSGNLFHHVGFLYMPPPHEVGGMKYCTCPSVRKLLFFNYSLTDGWILLKRSQSNDQNV